MQQRNALDGTPGWVACDVRLAAIWHKEKWLELVEMIEMEITSLIINHSLWYVKPSLIHIITAQS